MNGADCLVGDVVRAFASLQPLDDPSRAAIARLLGFEWSTPASGKPAAGRDIAKTARKRPERDLDFSPSEQREVQPTVPPKSSGAGPTPLLSPVARESPRPPLSWRVDNPLPRVRDDHLHRRPPHLALFDNHRNRGLLTACIATDCELGAVDTDKLVEVVAQGRAISSIPRRPWFSLLRGVQILVDIGQGMEPFARDQEEIIAAVRRWVGAESSPVMQFKGCPSRGAGEGPIWTWRDYEPPATKTPVLLLSDLGIGGPPSDPDRAARQEWWSFGVHLIRRSHHPVVLIPYPEERWPQRLRENLFSR